MASTVLSDLIKPASYAAYQTQVAIATSQLIKLGLLSPSALLSSKLAQGGDVFNLPSFDVLNGTENVSSDIYANQATPDGISTSNEVAVRLSRNLVFSSADILDNLVGEDIMGAISSQLSPLWNRKLQEAVLAVFAGVLADNAANDGSDMFHDVSGASFSAATVFSASHVTRARTQLGETQGRLATILMHSTVLASAEINDLITTRFDSEGRELTSYRGMKIMVSDDLPATSGVYDTYIVSPDFMSWGAGSPKHSIAVTRDELRGDGGGVETVITRQEWAIHPKGFAYTGTPAVGGPSNAATANNLAAAGSWNRVYGDRRQIGFVCLRTREA